MTLPFPKLLAPMDLDEISVLGLMIAGEIARGDGAELYLLHVVPVDEFALLQEKYRPWESGGGSTDHASEVAESTLARIARERLGESPRPRVLVRPGDPAEVILEVQRELSADLIIMGTHGRRALADARIGSVAEAVAREASCPVLTIRG